MSANAQDLINQLCFKNPADRIGANSIIGITEVFLHPYFEGVDIEGIKQRYVEVPFKPNTAKAF